MKDIITKIQSWFQSNGITGILGLILGVLFFFLNLYWASGFAFGVFFTRNWDILIIYFREFFKEKQKHGKF